MLVSWATQSAASTGEIVYFGTTHALGSSASGSSFVLTKNMTTPLRLHNAEITGLAGNNQIYYYRIADDNTVRKLVYLVWIEVEVY